MSSYQIYFSDRASSEYDAIAMYLNQEYGTLIANKFLDKIDEFLDVIEEHPFIFPLVSKKKNTHKCVIHKYVTLYYRVSEKEVELITFFNGKRSPRKLKL